MVWCYEYISDSGIHIATYMYMYAIILYDEVYDSLPAAWCLNDLQDPNWNIKSDQIPDLRSGKFHRNAISLETPYLWEKENRKNPWKSSDFLGLKSRTFPKILRVSWSHGRTRMVRTSPSGPLTSVGLPRDWPKGRKSDGDSTVKHEDWTTKVVLSLRTWRFSLKYIL